MPEFMYVKEDILYFEPVQGDADIYEVELIFTNLETDKSY